MPPPEAALVYDYLTARPSQPLAPADLIVGFGHFDQRIAHHCAHLWQQGLAPRILFTGGIGAGSADLSQPEAEVFAETLREVIPDFPLDRLLLDPCSTNTGENVRHSLAALTSAGWTASSALLVATPFRQRRVNQTWSHVAPHIHGQSAPPLSDLATDITVFAHKNEDLISQLPGEVERLQTYARRGWIAPTRIPPDVLTAAATLAPSPRQPHSRA